MGIFTKGGKAHVPEKTYLVKRCPECFVNLQIDATKCYSCKTRVGPVDRHGKAKKLFNWYAYGVCILAWVAFVIYIRWAFF